ncbi:MAG TPA: hypothetical protein VJ063_11250 [Verrucomicrobiae bacterium]|nr:hypothetical protein [Verrucomicrobiae bacterium]
MGLLDLFSRSSRKALVHLPSGSFTMDREGKIMTSTLPQSFPEHFILEIGKQVLTCFRGAERSHVQLSEIVMQYSALKILARELRGGAIVFLMPQAGTQQPVKRT